MTGPLERIFYMIMWPFITKRTQRLLINIVIERILHSWLGVSHAQQHTFGINFLQVCTWDHLQRIPRICKHLSILQMTATYPPGYFSIKLQCSRRDLSEIVHARSRVHVKAREEWCPSCYSHRQSTALVGLFSCIGDQLSSSIFRRIKERRGDRDRPLQMSGRM